MAWSTEAGAWYLPEHAEITRIALERSAPIGVARAIGRAVNDARATGLPLCDGVAVPFHAIKPKSAFLTSVASCIPYTALPALAGDHAVDTVELRSILQTPVSRWPFRDETAGAMIVGAAVAVWNEFRESASELFQSVYSESASNRRETVAMTSGHDVNRRKLTRDLDARLALVDPEYASRAAGTKAHFQDGVTPMRDQLLALVRAGATENALAQTLTHHLRSLQLARAARGDDTVNGVNQRAEALLEHAFALHFLQDAFASGHIATPAALSGDTQRLQRHDFLSRKGVAAKRALAVAPCDRQAPGVEQPTCWTAYGDGYMDADNMPIVADAAARLQLQFAIALDPTLVPSLLGRGSWGWGPGAPTT